ncbi:MULTISPECIES: aldehyde dehydrogenase family protein [Rhodococcus]|uniref:NAD-dependent aldehyde dehydrogenase n=1 Tax=Rhodococcus pyridinivorans AK37 TaxID=1114960 RepID=H0JUD6_9NOCA|nr:MULTISPECIES: aldehyde dehydrogenase family protein [Rhodococcus]EHK82234.1 NAD-dependent aldehyde dehydrogenase [Rhodococcus pyridinivorans AK37]
MTSTLQQDTLSAVLDYAHRPHGSLVGDAEIVTATESFTTVDPSTGATLTTIADADPDTVDQAVASAKAAFESEWGAMLPAQREILLNRFANLIEKHTAELAGYDALEGGKPVSFVEAVDLPLAVEQFRYYAGWPTKIAGQTVPVSTPDAHVYTRKLPLGVVAAITPWNFPLCQAAIKIAPALAAGNTVVIKPSELTSLSTLRLAELAREAGLPSGTVNVVTGRGTTAGQTLVSHPDVAKISFTGSERVGRHLGAEAGRLLKHSSLELGGKNPHIVFADADLTKAATAAATTAFFYSGQVCFSGSRLLVESSALDEVLNIIESYAANLVIGPGLERDTTLGPLVSSEHREKVEGYVSSVGSTGATIAFGGSRPNFGQGYFLKPTAIVNPKDTDAVVSEEIFGPVLTIQTFDSVDEVLTRANASDFGLTAGVWTDDARKAHRVAQNLRAGTVWVNTYADYNAAAPFGGFKSSGIGRDCGPEGLDKYLDTQTVWMSLA